MLTVGRYSLRWILYFARRFFFSINFLSIFIYVANILGTYLLKLASYAIQSPNKIAQKTKNVKIQIIPMHRAFKVTKNEPKSQSTFHHIHRDGATRSLHPIHMSTQLTALSWQHTDICLTQECYCLRTKCQKAPEKKTLTASLVRIWYDPRTIENRKKKRERKLKF